MVQLARGLNQDITYWAPVTHSGYGDTQFAQPVAMKARWQETSEEIQDKRGQSFVSRTKVMTYDFLEIDGYIMLGESADPDPTKLQGAREIRMSVSVPDLRNLQQVNVVYL